jgi:hypothetical protein
LLKPCESEDTTEDVFDSLDAFLAAEFPELDSECIPELASPMHSSSYSACPASITLPAVALPALSCSSTDSHGMQLMQQQHQQQASAPDVAESVAAAAAAAAAAKAQAQAFASLTGSGFSGMDASSLGRLGSTASTATCSAAVTAATGTTGAIPRWKLYHMQQRQELLAPKAASPKLQIIAGQGSAAAAPAGSCGSPLSAMSSGAACLSPVNALASTAAAAHAGVAAMAVPAQMVSADQLLLLNLHQQQQLALQQQQQHCAVIVGAKRQWAEPVGAPVTVLPCKAKRSRVTAAGNTAAQHMYGLSAEPSQHLQLQVLQLQLQQQIQQNVQQQAEIYQQQQLQALHNQLHMRLQVQQHPLAFQPPTQTRHKRQATCAGRC